MPRWTRLRKIADKKAWYGKDFDNDDPACYELWIGKSRSQARPVYIGETDNETRRMKEYASHGSHLSEIIDEYLNRGYSLYYRAIALPSKKAAEQMQDNLLMKFRYDWNILGNP